MKRIKYCFIVFLLLFVVDRSSAETVGQTYAFEQEWSLEKSNEDVIVYKYRMWNGKVQYRRWNKTKGYWVDANWIDI